ncbi:MAG TPA: hypothetical protein VIJ15_14230 [Dermatophilaceae bacterium]
MATELAVCDLSDQLGIAAGLHAAGASMATIDTFVRDTRLAWEPAEFYVEVLALRDEGVEVTAEAAYDAAVRFHREELDADCYLAARRDGHPHDQALTAESAE